MTIANLGPLDWRIPIVTEEGRPTQEFQRRWAAQIGNNSQIGSITIGAGPPPADPAPADGAQYADTSTTPYTLYIGGGGTWHLAGVGSANPTAVAKDTAVNGTASTFMRSDAAPAVQKASSSQFGIVQVDGTTITESGGIISAASSGIPDAPIDGTTYGRKDAGWVPVTGGGGGGGWTLIANDTISTPVSGLIYDVSNYDEIILVSENTTVSTAGIRQVTASVNGGITFFNTLGDYVYTAGGGTVTNNSAWADNTASNAGARYLIAQLYGLRTTGTHKLASSTRTNQTLFVASSLPVTHIRFGQQAGNLTGGTVYVLGK